MDNGALSATRTSKAFSFRLISEPFLFFSCYLGQLCSLMLYVIAGSGGLLFSAQFAFSCAFYIWVAGSTSWSKYTIEFFPRILQLSSLKHECSHRNNVMLIQAHTWL